MVFRRNATGQVWPTVELLVAAARIVALALASSTTDHRRAVEVEGVGFCCRTIVRRPNGPMAERWGVGMVVSTVAELASRCGSKVVRSSEADGDVQ